jgi:hypothetical protein
MRLLIDTVCPSCGDECIDVFVQPEAMPACRRGCAGTVERLWRKAVSVIPDDIPGGVLIEHGLCNADGSPRRYYSKSEMALEAKKRGLTPWVMHTTNAGTDKSEHTSRWI